MLHTNTGVPSLEFCHISHKPMTVPKSNFLQLKRKIQGIYGRKLKKIKISIFYTVKVKVHKR